MKKLITLTLALVIALLSVLSMSACTKENGDNTYTIGICNYVDDASLNQIVSSLRSRLDELTAAGGITVKIDYQNCNADANTMNQIISNFIVDKVDLMVGVATPVAMAMQNATEDNRIPVVFAAVSDPLSAGLVESLNAPGGNLTGTSDFLDTTAIMNLIFAADPTADKIGLLYDMGQDSSTGAIAAAKKYLTARGVAFVERTGTNVDEIVLAASALVNDGVDAIFTPSDNTVMTAELAIYETLRDAGIPHYAGADSFALNGAFLGYGVDYENLGRETADMIYDILVNKKDPAGMPVRTFDNGTATINTEIASAMGLSYDALAELFRPLCSKVCPITTANSFDELN